MININEVRELRDMLLECLALQEKVFGTTEPEPEESKAPQLVKEEEPEKPEAEQPVKAEAPKPPEQPVKKAKKLDKGKIMALHNAGWSNEKIADEMKCSPRTVLNIIYNESRKARV